MASAVVTLHAPGRQETLEPRFEPRKIAVSFGLIAGGLCALFAILPSGEALLIALPVLAVWVWREPVRGVYVLVAGAAMIEIFRLNFSDSLTDKVPLFLNLNNTVGFDFPITPAEILMVITGAVAVARTASDQALRWPRGKLFNAYCIYVGVVLLAEVHGLVGGGDFKLSLWELRPQIYGFIVFVLTGTLLENREQLKRLAFIFLLAVGAKALIGTFRYFVTLHGNLGTGLEVLAHEDSYFLSLFITAGLASLVWIKDRRFVVFMTLGSAVAMLTLLANSRRAGLFALAGAVAVIALLAFKFEPALRKRIAWLTILAVIGGSGFLVYAWDKQYGIQAQLVRPVRSLVDPSDRDFSSDLYRTAETNNVHITYRTSPIIGVGFGSPFIIAWPMADISSTYPLWNVIPHNSLMWVGMRMGALGFAAFWALIGLAVLMGFDLMRTRRDPLIRVVTAFALAAIAAEIAVGYTDLQLENYRNLILFGAVLGLLTRLPALKEARDV